MPANHLHLIINHVPVIGSIFAMVTLAWGIISRRDQIVRLAMWFFVGVGLSAAVAYLTGDPAEHAVEGLFGFSEAMLEEHEDIAMWALLLAGLTGLLSVFGLLRLRQRNTVSHSLLILLIIAGIMTSAVMGWTAMEGGKIRRPELRDSTSVEMFKPAEATLTAPTIL